MAEHPPKSFTYGRWRHGGWYVNIRYPSGASGCVSNNFEDRKWRIVCDPRPFEEQPTFNTRDEAALAEWHLIDAMKRDAREAALLGALKAIRARIDGEFDHPILVALGTLDTIANDVHQIALDAISKARG